MNEAKKMKKGMTLPFDENSRRLIIILVALLFITGITKSSQFLNVGNVQSIGKQLTEYGCLYAEWWNRSVNRLYRKSLWY